MFLVRARFTYKFDSSVPPPLLDFPDDGISIPADSVSYLAPISCPKLWCELNAAQKRKSFETSYVVMLHNFFALAEAQEVFRFDHPNRDAIIDNNRFKQMTFHLKESATIHGFAGYFDSKLYKDVHISIYPKTFSEGMFSWFPIYFPIKSPVCVPKGTQLDVSFWRVVSSHKVWYEWCLGGEFASPIHNPNGRSQFIGL